MSGRPTAWACRLPLALPLVVVVLFAGGAGGGSTCVGDDAHG